MQGTRNMAVMLMLVASMVLGAMVVTGCTVAEKAADNPRIAQLVVQNRTLGFIDGDRDKAGSVLRIAERIHDSLERDRLERVSEIERMAEEEIPWEALSDAEQRQVRNLMAVIQSGFERYAEGDERISEEQKVEFRALMRYVIEAAELVP